MASPQAVTTICSPAPTPRFAPRMRRGATRAVEAWATTPGQLRAARVLSVLLILVTGGLATYGGGVRIQATRDIATRSEPVSSDAIEAYRSLADADVTAAAGFLPGAPAADRERYEQDIERAAASLARAAARTGGEGLTLDRISDITAALPVYTGLVERARAGRAGGSDMEQASELMQSTLLRRAQALQRDEARRLSDRYERAAFVPRFALGCGLATLSLLLVVQVRLFRRTRRILNVGLAVATVLIVGLMLWWALALSVSQNDLADSRRHSRSVTDALGQAQIAARQARSSEILALVVDPGRAAIHDEQFTARAQRLARDDGAGGALGAARHLSSTPDGPALVEAAVLQTRTWLTQHAQVRRLTGQDGDDQAVAVAVGPAAAAFDQLDTTLARAVDGEQAAFQKDITSSRRALQGLLTGTVLLALAAAACVSRGIGQRLEEYR